MTPADRTAWIVSLDIDAYAKSVLHALAHRADANTGRCWPSMRRLARDAGVSVRKARDVTRQLQAVGLIDVSISVGKSSNSYTVRFGANPAPRAALHVIQPGTARRVESLQPGTIRRPTRHRVPVNPAQRADRTGKEQIKEQAPAPAAPSIWDLWTAIAGESKRSLLGKLIKSYGEEQVAAAVANTSRKRPADPTQYLIGVLKANSPPPAWESAI